MIPTCESLAGKRKALHSLFIQSLENDESINDKVINEFLSYEDMIRSFQKVIELKYNVKIRYEPQFTIVGTPCGIEKGDSLWIDEMNELLKNIDFRKEFTQKYEVSLIESRLMLKDLLKEKLEAKLQERRGSTSSMDDDLNRSEVINTTDSKDMLLPNAASNIKGKTLQVNKKITSNLLRTNQILRSSVLQSELNLDELTQQTDTLMLVNDKFDRFKAMSQASLKLIKAINSSSYQEKRKVYAAITFFCCCILWVLWRRIFKYPVKLVFWLCFRIFKSMLYTVGLVKNSASFGNATDNYDHDSYDIYSNIATALTATLETLIANASESSPTTLDLENAISSSFDKLMDEL